MPHVLIVDDHTINRRLATAMLRREGWEVDEVEDGLHAMRWLEEKRPDLILLDISMPDLTGEEVCIRLRAMPEYATLPIIAYTAHAMPQDIERFLANGFDAVLTKPISLNSLREALDKVGFSRTA